MLKKLIYLTSFILVLSIGVMVVYWFDTSPKCPSTKNKLSHLEILGFAYEHAKDQGIFNNDIDKYSVFLSENPDCCFLVSRGYRPSNPIEDWSLPFVSTVDFFVNINHHSVPQSAKSSNRPLYKHSILMSRCGEFLWGGGRPVDQNSMELSKELEIFIKDRGEL